MATKTKSEKPIYRLVLLSVMILTLPIESVYPAETKGQEERILQYSYSGSKTLGREFTKAMAHPEVQQLLLEMAESPRSVEHIENALNEIDITLSDLINLQLIRQDGDRYNLAFVLFTREDMDLIRTVSEEMGKLLAEGILARRIEIESIIKSDIPSGADWRETAYFVIGCVSLDWDGLNISRSKGFLTQPKPGEYKPEAVQPGGGGSKRALYWGSHNNHSEIAITSFGDHYSSIRQALPDITWRMKVDAPDPLNKSLIDAASRLIRLGVGRIMIALREADLNLSELSVKTELPEDETKRLVKLLLDLDYIVEVDTRYRATITVLTERDRKRVNQLRQIGKNVIQNWFDENYTDMCEEFSDLTPVKYGIPLADGFYWVWHYIFGIANRELVKSGLFADPYDPDRRFQGYIPAVYLYDVVTD
jgi:hypothetical protein